MTSVFIVYYDDYQPKTCSVHDTRVGAETAMICFARAEMITERVPRYPMDLRVSDDGRLERYEPRNFGPPWNQQYVEWQFTDYWIEEHEVKSDIVSITTSEE